MAVINYLTKILFDEGALVSLADEVAQLKLKKLLLVTDPGVVACGLAQAAVDHLPQSVDVQ